MPGREGGPLAVRAGVPVVSWVGVRRDESPARAQLPGTGPLLDDRRTPRRLRATLRGAVWRPLLAWSIADVWAMHARHGVDPNPLYLQDAKRVGCAPCIFAQLEEIRLHAPAGAGLARHQPEEGRELPPVPELPPVAEGGRQGRRGERADPGDGRQALAHRRGAMPLPHFPVEVGEPPGP